MVIGTWGFKPQTMLPISRLCGKLYWTLDNGNWTMDTVQWILGTALYIVYRIREEIRNKSFYWSN